LHRRLEHPAFDFEFPSHLTALPVRLVAIPHEEFQGRFAGQKRIMLSQISDPKLRVPDDFTGVQLVIAKDALEQGGLSRTVSAYEADFVIPTQSAFSTVEEDLVTIAFVRVSDLKQYGH
jgi:hypothetical protein